VRHFFAGSWEGRADRVPPARSDRHSFGESLRKNREIITNCRYGIHDICRTELDRKIDTARFNCRWSLIVSSGAKRIWNHRKLKAMRRSDKDDTVFRIPLPLTFRTDIHSHEGALQKLIENWHRAQMQSPIPKFRADGPSARLRNVFGLPKIFPVPQDHLMTTVGIPRGWWNT